MLTQTTFTKFVTAQFLFALMLTVAASITAAGQNQQAKAGAQYHLKRGNAYAAQQKWQRAIAEYDQALVMDSHHAAAYDARGVAWLALEDVGMALRDFNRALKLTPDNATLYAHRGQALQAKGKAREAEQDFTRSRELASSLYSNHRRRN